MTQHDPLQAFGARLRRLRESTGLSQQDFGRIGGVTKSTQYLYEQAGRLPDVGYLIAIRAFFAIDLDELIAGSDAPDALLKTNLNVEQVMSAFRSAVQIDRSARPLSDAGLENIFSRLLLQKAPGLLT